MRKKPTKKELDRLVKAAQQSEQVQEAIMKLNDGFTALIKSLLTVIEQEGDVNE